MKTYFLFASLLIIMLLACTQEPPTQVAKNYTLEEILSDTNWVEITDTIDVTKEVRCLSREIFEKGIRIESESDYAELWAESKNIDIYEKINCKDTSSKEFESPMVDFDKRSVLGFYNSTGRANIKRQIFMNKIIKKIIYYTHFDNISGELIYILYYRCYSIPKIEKGYQVLFDTNLSY